jgi:hypothetical protein
MGLKPTFYAEEKRLFVFLCTKAGVIVFVVRREQPLRRTDRIIENFDRGHTVSPPVGWQPLRLTGWCSSTRTER